MLNLAKLTAAREAKGWTQAEAARRAGLSRQRWHDIESGRKDNMELGTLCAVATALECDPSALLSCPKVPAPAKGAKKAAAGKKAKQ